MILIDKDQTFKTLSEYYHHTGTLQHMALREALDKVPVVDAVPVIRCRDCKWWRADKESCLEWYDSPYAEANGYCSRAERKEK